MALEAEGAAHAVEMKAAADELNAFLSREEAVKQDARKWKVGVVVARVCS